MAVVGAGFGGLAAALTLAEAGVRVVLFETVGYPGGCAATFERRGRRFEAGATLVSGFGPRQLMSRWVERYRLPVELRRLDPMVDFRTPDFRLEVPSRRAALVDRIAALPGAPRRRLEAFFAHQKRLADPLWSLFEDPNLLPPLSGRALLRHLARMPAYAPLLPWIGRPLAALVARHGLEGFRPLTTYLDAVCQITVQAGLAQAETLYAAAAADYYFRGTGHVEGGVGRLAEALVQALEARGGEVRFFDRAEALRPSRGGWHLATRRGKIHARAVVANLLPGAVRKLLPEELPRRPAGRLARLQAQVEGGWGAAMLYLVVDGDAFERPEAHHLQLVADPDQPLEEGRHLFCSVSAASETDRAPAGRRTVTISTHVPMTRLRSLEADPLGRGAYVARVQDTMRETLGHLAPEIAAAVEEKLTASPRTFERFTGRPEGFVGGVPRRAGLGNYRGLSPRAWLPGLYLVGDSVFPGQSTFAAALGGRRTASALLRRL